MAHPELDPSKLFDVSGIIAVVTGGGTGIGLMIATALEHNGAIVYIVGRRMDVLEAAAREHSRHGNLIPLQGDVTSRASLLALAAAVHAQRGYINLLVNNAGVARNMLWRGGVPALAPAGDICALQARLWSAGGPADWAATFATNVAGAYDAAVVFLALLHAGNARAPPGAPTSQVVTVSSVGGFRRDARVFSVSYGASKAAATHLGRALAGVLRAWCIRSNVVAPGIYPSEMTEGLVSMTDVGADAVPLRRNGTVEDMGGLILFLASRAGAYVNGAVYLTDGGRLGLFSSTY